MKKLKLVILIFTLLPSSLSAWGKEGHHIVVEIAFDCLDATTKKNVLKYLGGTSIESASVWMDSIRSDHSYDYMKPMHYVNIEPGKRYIPNSDPNIINELNRVVEELGNKDSFSKEQVKMDLMILIHLIGDIHQPLHDGYADDRGGNSVKVNFLNKETNLHHVWDSDIIEYKKISTSKCLSIYKSYNKDQIYQIKKGFALDWMYQSRELLGKVYDIKNNVIDIAYIDSNTLIIEEQLVKAGIRLASLLEHYFKN